ncbi:hypothetical protein [Sphingobium yanoikuyae]|uniref:hypothetical protein n=1 Tax=Sphingobium yanoikuyae TaxID=13690 RepID=UPI00244D2537|nr:hypothetical protein [Sphingobium yanoikuyae]MDH2148160.1 hypothetical protein [Sphingobium yanoikuyae]
MGDDGHARDRIAFGATLLGMSGSDYLPSLMADGPMLPSPRRHPGLDPESIQQSLSGAVQNGS